MHRTLRIGILSVLSNVYAGEPGATRTHGPKIKSSKSASGGWPELTPFRTASGTFGTTLSLSHPLDSPRSPAITADTPGGRAGDVARRRDRVGDLQQRPGPMPRDRGGGGVACRAPASMWRPPARDDTSPRQLGPVPTWLVRNPIHHGTAIASGPPSRYVRGAFFAARRFTDLDDLYAQADDWCRGVAADRRCPGKSDRTVRDDFAEEVPRLLPLPDNPVPPLERVAVNLRDAGDLAARGSMRRGHLGHWVTRPPEISTMLPVT
jgi:hypothetical protein